MKRISTLPLLQLCLQLLPGAALLVPSAGWSLDLERDDVKAFVSELAATENFDEAYLESVLGDSEIQQSIIDAMSKPAEKAKPWHEYRAIFITPERIAAGVEF